VAEERVAAAKTELWPGNGGRLAASSSATRGRDELSRSLTRGPI